MLSSEHHLMVSLNTHQSCALLEPYKPFRAKKHFAFRPKKVTVGCATMTGGHATAEVTTGPFRMVVP